MFAESKKWYNSAMCVESIVPNVDKDELGQQAIAQVEAALEQINSGEMTPAQQAAKLRELEETLDEQMGLYRKKDYPQTAQKRTELFQKIYDLKSSLGEVAEEPLTTSGSDSEQPSLVAPEFNIDFSGLVEKVWESLQPRIEEMIKQATANLSQDTNPLAQTTLSKEPVVTQPPVPPTSSSSSFVKSPDAFDPDSFVPFADRASTQSSSSEPSAPANVEAPAPKPTTLPEETPATTVSPDDESVAEEPEASEPPAPEGAKTPMSESPVGSAVEETTPTVPEAVVEESTPPAAAPEAAGDQSGLQTKRLGFWRRGGKDSSQSATAPLSNEATPKPPAQEKPATEPPKVETPEPPTGKPDGGEKNEDQEPYSPWSVLEELLEEEEGNDN